MDVTSTFSVTLDEDDIRAALVAHVKAKTGHSIAPAAVTFRSGKRAMTGTLSATMKGEGQSGVRPASDREPEQVVSREAALAEVQKMGAQAKADGVSIRENPYPESSAQGQAWLKGYTGP